MKNFLLFIFLLICISCSKSTFDIEEKRTDINAIINSVIEADSINIAKNNSEKNKIVQFLKKIKIVISKHDNNIIEPVNKNEIKLDEIYSSSYERVFSEKDSDYLLFQNTNPDSLEIGEKLKEKYNYSELSKILEDRHNGNNYQYYEFTIPFFSKDNNTAYIELNYHSKGYFGKGIAYILKKNHGKWKVIDKRGTWIN